MDDEAMPSGYFLGKHVPTNIEDDRDALQRHVRECERVITDANARDLTTSARRLRLYDVTTAVVATLHFVSDIANGGYWSDMSLRSDLGHARACVDKAIDVVVRHGSAQDISTFLGDFLVEMQYLRSQRFPRRFQRYDRLEEERCCL